MLRKNTNALMFPIGPFLTAVRLTVGFYRRSRDAMPSRAPRARGLEFLYVGRHGGGTTTAGGYLEWVHQYNFSVSPSIQFVACRC